MDGTPSTRTLLLVACAVVSTGCAVLTQSQLDSVHDFAVASKGYAPLPPRVIEAYGDLRAQREVLHLAALPYGSPDAGAEAVQQLERTTQKRARTRDDAERLATSLAVLDAYGALLEQLTSNGLPATLDDASQDAGGKIDDAIKALDEANHLSLPSFGSAAASAARAAGGLYLSARQAQYAKTFVEHADPVIQMIAKLVADALAPYTSAAGADSVFAAERAQLEQSLTLVSKKPSLAYGELAGYYQALSAADRAQKLADRTVAASRDYAAAHAKLKAALGQKLTLANGIDEVKALSKDLVAKDECEERR